MDELKEIEKKLENCYLAIDAFSALDRLQQIYEKYPEKEEEIKKLLKGNSKKIIDNMTFPNVEKMLSIISKISSEREFIEDNFEYIFSSNRKLNTGVTTLILEKAIELKMNKKIIDNISSIINSIDGFVIPYLVLNLEKIPETDKIIKKYCKELIEKCNSIEMDKLIFAFKEVPNICDVVNDHLSYIIQKAGDFTIPKLVHELQDVVDSKELCEKTEELINRCPNSCIIDFLEQMNKKEDTKNELEKYKEQLITKIITQITGWPKQGLEKEKIYDFILVVLKEICEKENASILSIRKIGNGHHATSYQIGEKVIKIGSIEEENSGYPHGNREKKRIDEIPYHRRILQPILRRPISNLDRTKNLFYIEITQRVLNSNETEITEDDVYEVYKELRNDGIVWVDAGIKNLGKLKRPNIVHMENFNEVDENSVGIERREEKKEILPEGEFVIFDSHYICREEDIKDEMEELMSMFSEFEKFETRYQEEKTAVR